MRGLLSCRWLEQNGSHPPVIVDELIDATVRDNESVREKAHHLLELKRMGRSHDMTIVDDQLADYMFGLQKYYEQVLPKYKDIKPQADLSAMSKYLMNVVMRKRQP
jgi:predicted nucleotidyltransferase